MNIDVNAYQSFTKKVVNEYRFVFDDESAPFQAMLKATTKGRVTEIDLKCAPANTILSVSQNKNGKL